ncbi:MAG TPA: hypothetical protein VL978_02035 [Puia sp.]|nr:hypothetical protein [Puia sp.]
MERLKELISQLLEQVDRKAEPSQMLQTTQLLEAELRFLAAQPPPGRVMPTKIAVMMPSAARITPSPGEAPAKAGPAQAPSNGTPAPIAASNGVANPNGIAPPNGVAASNGVPTPSGVAGPNGIAAPNGASNPNSASIPNAAPVPNGTAVATAARPKEPERGVWPFDPLAEKPTDRFTLSQKSREINDIIGGVAGSSLNEKLKPEIVDLRSALNDTPVRDLKKAIGVNDRYVFVNQLFRGDEAMYERSIKTINGFRILPEAEYWMERELKVKLGWDENSNITRHFYQLVKRRFS